MQLSPGPGSGALGRAGKGPGAGTSHPTRAVGWHKPIPQGQSWAGSRPKRTPWCCSVPFPAQAMRLLGKPGMAELTGELNFPLLGPGVLTFVLPEPRSVNFCHSCRFWGVRMHLVSLHQVFWRPGHLACFGFGVRRAPRCLPRSELPQQRPEGLTAQPCRLEPPAD